MAKTNNYSWPYHIQVSEKLRTGENILKETGKKSYL
jgi:hypothetical protein